MSPACMTRWLVEAAPLGRALICHRVAAAELRIGRDPANEVVLPAPDVSRRHVRVWLQAGCVWAQDESSNGTLCDGRPMDPEPRPLEAGSELRLGSYRVRVRVDPPLASASSADLESVPSPSRAPAVPQPRSPRVPAESGSERAEDSLALRRRARDLLLERLDLNALSATELVAERMRPRVEEALERIWQDLCAGVVDEAGRAAWLKQMLDEALGLGPLEPLLEDPGVSEIMVVDRDTIYVERQGRVVLCDARFTDDIALRSAIERIVTPLGRRIDVASPMVDARLEDGSRVNAVIEPLALRGPCLTIRRFPRHRLKLDDLVDKQALSEPMARFLRRCVAARLNVVISGGTGSGKTTLLNVLSAFIGDDERVVTIEDAAELSLAQPHVVPLEARPANAEGLGAVTIRDLVKNALRMRPDRIVVGECRGGEAFDMLQAMNTGHDGSMTTTHANSPTQALQRLETLCLMSGVELPAVAVRRQIAASVDLVVQLARGADGRRRVTDISEVLDFDEESGALTARAIFAFRASSSSARAQVQGTFRPTGYMPSFLELFLRSGLATAGDAL